MAEAVAGLLASAFVTIAKKKLSSAISEQASLLWNFGDDLEDMNRVLETISAALEDAERRSVKEKLVRLWLKRLKDAALDISDMLEDYQDTGDQAEAKMPGWVSYKKMTIANGMKSLREKLGKISNEIYSFSFKEVCRGTTNEQPYDERETTSYLPEEPVIGRDREKQEIINLLAANTCNDEIVIVPIYGLGGMGKSTLAQLVYNDAQFKHYDHRVWVYVSQDFNLNKIGSSIISQLQPQGGQQNLCIQQVINQCLESLLCGKKVLVVLDDLWEEREPMLVNLRKMLRIKDSKVDVIVTTRKEDIARNFCTGEPYKLQTLEDDKSWEIIKRYSKFELKSNQEKMGQIGLDIAKKCGGVALAAQAVGFMLRSIDDLSGWKEINDSDIWNGSSEGCDVLPSLKLSYERMPPELRICFSYCAIFPKGYNIVEEDLVQQWIALDFTEQRNGKKYINKLLGMSFLQVSKLPSASQGHVVRYTMHDLVHDLARLTVADELIVFDVAPQRNTQVHKYCRYALLRKYDRTVKLENMPSDVRALRFSDNGELDIRSGAFSFAKCLHTLDFSECSGILLPSSIGRLKQLRCLIAPRMKNDSLPEFITELSKLQYLNINGSSQISALPESIGKLECLQYLCLSGCPGISKLTESFGDLKCMVHLDMSGCSGLTELPESLGNLTNLQHLNLSGCSSVKVVPESFCGLTRLQYLNLSSCACIKELPGGIGSLVAIQHLYMSNCEQIKELPESLMELQNLLHLDLSCCRRMQRLGGVRGLITLEHLDLSCCSQIGLQDLSDALTNLTNVKYLSVRNVILHGSYVPNWIGGLTKLEHLVLSSNYGLVSLPGSIGNLTRLHTLDLTRCTRLKSLPENIGTLLRLKSLLLDSCSIELMDRASSLVHHSKILPFFRVRADGVNGGSCSNLYLLEDENVGELRIHFLENVRSLEEATKVKLFDKYNLSKLTLAWSTERADQIFEDKDLLGQLVPPKGLKHMHLQGYNCTSFPVWLMDISCYLRNLVYIRLQDLPTCSNLPPLGQLRHLEKLELCNLPGIKRIDREFCGGRGAFRRLTSFKVTKMKGLKEWNTTYSVEEGLEELMFPVLGRLEIQYCSRLRLKPCPPAFRECHIYESDQVISSLEEVDKTSHHCSSSSPAIKLDLTGLGYSCQSIRLFHHFPLLRELTISGDHLMNVPESMQHLTSLESLTLQCCYSMSALPEWLGNLSSLKSLVITACDDIKSLPLCIEQLTKLQNLEIRDSRELKKWCESEENKAKLAHINNFRVFEEEESSDCDSVSVSEEEEGSDRDSVSPPNPRPVNTTRAAPPPPATQNSATPPPQPATAPSALALPWYGNFWRKLWYGNGCVPDVAAAHEPGPELPVTGLGTDTTGPVPEHDDDVASAFAKIPLDQLVSPGEEGFPEDIHLEVEEEPLEPAEYESDQDLPEHDENLDGMEVINNAGHNDQGPVEPEADPILPDQEDLLAAIEANNDNHNVQVGMVLTRFEELDSVWSKAKQADATRLWSPETDGEGTSKNKECTQTSPNSRKRTPKRASIVESQARKKSRPIARARISAANQGEEEERAQEHILAEASGDLLQLMEEHQDDQAPVEDA